MRFLRARRSICSEREALNLSPRLRLRWRGLEGHEPQLFRGRGRREPVGGDRDCVRLPTEAPPSHADVAEQPHPGIRLGEVGRELPVNFERLPIVLPPGLEHRMEFAGLLGVYGESRAATKSVDCHSSFPVEQEAMTAWNMIEPAVSVLEIGGLETKRGNHRREGQMAGR